MSLLRVRSSPQSEFRTHELTMQNHVGDTFTARLEGGEVHVWNVSPTPVFHSQNDLSACLSDEEHQQAALRRDEALRLHFIAVRFALRHVLSRYIDEVPADVPLRRETSGKLVLDRHQDVHFSLTHSGPIALIAVAAAPTGIDAEHIREPQHLDRTARRILHPDTVSTLAELPPHRRIPAFIAAWTLREAHVKALGGGLFRTPDTLPFDATIQPDASLHRVVDRLDAHAWSIAHFAPTAESLAAVVVRAHVDRIRFFDHSHISEDLS
jgi:4'-phosphopantetheinyl transferase